MSFRTGLGFDAHAFQEGRRLVLGGVVVPHSRGLAGHSDADVLTHALMDALLGACGERDIGEHFPDHDPAYEGISSLVLLEEVVGMVREKGYRVVNADCVVVAQEPRLAPYIQGMREALAFTMGVELERVGVKATTTEGLGFPGRGEGIAAMATVLLQKPAT
ncbi:MAG: 2-C-methyl-D-erythritol 2,4-cyclodiphosphate synthase [Actinobacteria bacterium]|nr:2-C-methyl-D-erythritol 2,4-cyclodiphosphate synthase [Actinomycetota bacterium]MDI6830968.1 2-C-methyl-D-erythritol 2,4-cyclodiphosphate synthase [Actinomycetota bacterium]